MARSKEGREEEYYKGIIRALKKENKHLKKLVNRLLKEQDREEEPTEVKPSKEICNECGKGFMQEVRVLDRVWKHCDLCSYRTRAKKI